MKRLKSIRYQHPRRLGRHVGLPLNALSQLELGESLHPRYRCVGRSRRPVGRFCLAPTLCTGA
jgi:hypothetical protein